MIFRALANEQRLAPLVKHLHRQVRWTHKQASCLWNGCMSQMFVSLVLMRFHDFSFFQIWPITNIWPYTVSTTDITCCPARNGGWVDLRDTDADCVMKMTNERRSMPRWRHALNSSLKWRSDPHKLWFNVSFWKGLSYCYTSIAYSHDMMDNIQTTTSAMESILIPFHLLFAVFVTCEGERHTEFHVDNYRFHLWKSLESTTVSLTPWFQSFLNWFWRQLSWAAFDWMIF